jgi:2-amino-4-hydroxy-6-hydroxymethyldihydropteridine diphosphokinase
VNRAPAPVEKPAQWAFVALGSNLGDSIALVRRATARLEALSLKPLLRSSLWKSEPINCPPGSPPFTNAVVGLLPRSAESPDSLLEKLQALESEFGRRSKHVLNEPRPLDLDLIAFGSQTRTAGSLILPHPRAHLRRFVLQPLSEIAPGLVLPGQSQTVQQLLDSLGDDQPIAPVSCREN